MHNTLILFGATGDLAQRYLFPSLLRLFVDGLLPEDFRIRALALSPHDTDAFRDLLKSTGTVYMKGDWTDVNATIAAFLEHYHSVGVPLYVVYGKSGGDGTKLSTVLTYDKVKTALEAASHP